MHDGRVVLPTLSCVGFEPPVAGGPVRVRNHRVLPLKARLLDADGAAVADTDLASPPVLRVLLDPGTGPEVDVTASALTAGRGTGGPPFSFEYAGRWQLNLATTGYAAPGTYRVRMESGDAARYAIAPTCEGTFVLE